jgi:hypothetical protein
MARTAVTAVLPPEEGPRGSVLSPADWRRVTTGPDGSFAFEDLPLAPVELSAVDREELLAETRISVPPDVTQVDLRIRAYGAVDVAVLDAAGRPVHDVDVSITSPLHGNRARVDDLRIWFPTVPPGVYHVVAVAASGSARVPVVVREGPQRIELRLQSVRFAITGRVLRGEDGHAVRGQVVELWSRSGRRETRTDAVGAFRFDDAELDAETVQVEQEGYHRIRRPLAPDARNIDVGELVLEPTW